MARKKQETDAAPAEMSSGGTRRLKVTVRGRAPGLLMCSKGGMDANPDGKQAKIASPEVQARNAAYWTADGSQLALPWENLYKAVVAGAKRFRFKGRESMEKIVAATIACEEELIPLGTDQYQHHARWGRIPPKTGGVVMLHRALLPKWEASFVMLVDDEFYPADSLKKVLETAGKLVGVCANRPELKGPYGRFEVTGWEVTG